MGPVGHTLMSSAVGAGVWTSTGSPAAALTAVGVGVLMDLDHLYDYYQWFIAGRRDRIYLLLHGWEYSIAALAVALLVFNHPLLLAAAVAHLVHVATDHLHNGLTPFGYSIIYRVSRRFRVKDISPVHDVEASYRHVFHHMPYIERVVGPWLDRWVEPWLQRRAQGAAGLEKRAGYQTED